MDDNPACAGKEDLHHLQYTGKEGQHADMLATPLNAKLMEIILVLLKIWVPI